MAERIPSWEFELWSYLSNGDGAHCPLISCCRVRQTGGWCFDNKREYFNQLIDCDWFNPSSFDFIKCGTRCKLFKAVKMLADRYLKKGGVYCPPVPIELASLADDNHPIDVHLLPLKVYHSAIWCLSDRWVIQLKKDDTSAEQRFSLFHEVFHILGHRRTTPVFQKRGDIRGSFNECLADYFSACVLMPEEWVKGKWAEVKDWGMMAKLFNVPESVMYARLKRLGLV